MASVHARIEVDDAALERESGSHLRRKHRSLTRRIANQARADVPVRTGNLGRTIAELPQTYTPYHVSGGVEATADYAAAVHEGSRAHRIHARPGGTLHFFWGGQEFFRKSVWRPATRARPFLRNAGTRVVSTDPDVRMG